MDSVNLTAADAAAGAHLCLCHYGFNSATFDRWGEAMIDVFLMQPHIQGCPEARRIWMKLIAYIVDQVAGAFDRGLKRTRVRSVSADPNRSTRIYGLPAVNLIQFV